jgi:hypothetical protein
MDETVYQLTIEDIQNVARQELERELSVQEIDLIRNRIAEKILWYDVIADSLSEIVVAN